MWAIPQGRLLVTYNEQSPDMPVWVAVEAWPPA
jgi:hypothetical protein